MDTLTLPEPGWALAYPSPLYDVAYLLHLPCGERSDAHCMPEYWASVVREVADLHRCAQGGAE